MTQSDLASLFLRDTRDALLGVKHNNNQKRRYPILTSYLRKFSRNRAGPDLLFAAEYHHVGAFGCGDCDKSKLTVREPRPESIMAGHDTVTSVVHYGTIATKSQDIRDAMTRDKLSLQFGGSLCFPRGAAVSKDTDVPCLVIQGICDYADSHGSDFWHPHAAFSAANYAYNLMYTISSTEMTRLVIDHIHRQLPVSEKTLKSVIPNPNAVALISGLYKYQKGLPVSEDVLKIVATQMDALALMSLFLEHENELPVSEEVLKIVATQTDAVALMSLFLGYYNELPVSEELLKIVATQMDAVALMSLFLEYDNELPVSEELLKIVATRIDAVALMSLFFDYKEDLPVSEEFVMGALIHHDAETLIKLFLEKKADLLVSEELVEAATRQRRAVAIIGTLFANKEDVPVSEEVVKVAVMHQDAETLLKLFLENKPDLPVSENIVKEVTRRQDTVALKLLTLFFELKQELLITEEVIKTAALRQDAVTFMNFLLKYKENLPVSEEVIKKAATNDHAMAIISIFREQEGEKFQVSEGLIESIAERHGATRLAKLLTKRRETKLPGHAEIFKIAIERGGAVRLAKMLLLGDRENQPSGPADVDRTAVPNPSHKEGVGRVSPKDTQQMSSINTMPDETSISKSNLASAISSAPNLSSHASHMNNTRMEADLRDTTDGLVDMLLVEYELNTSSEAAPKNELVRSDRFGPNFTKSLELFSVNLRDESQEASHLQLADFVSLKAGLVASRFTRQTGKKA